MSRTVKVDTPSDREIRVTRAFAAPRTMLWDAHTKPELVKRWLWGPDEWRLAECEIDLRVGGAFRYVWRNTGTGDDMGMGGVYRRIDAPALLQNTELFDEDWTGGETLVTSEFEEKGAETVVIVTVFYTSKQARDGALASGMIEGWSQSYGRLDGLLETEAAK
ncbi:MAG: SRPBCC domain-containing protein [Maricaulaceae bacterium]|nr:SRPBCC domain-containing protein [Maricaulaceae bacterium]